MNPSITYKPLTRAGVFLGIGLGGFVDGIVFHQILQFHHMLTGRIPKDSVAHIQINMFWDGMFHALTWAMTVIGLTLLWRAGKRADVPWSVRTFVGSQLLGWGLFNLVEGVLNHHLFHLHHVVESLGVSVFDYLFLASGVILIIVGIIAIRSERERELVFHPLPRAVPGA